MKDEKIMHLPSEISVNSLLYADMVELMPVLDGMKLCAGCDDTFVLAEKKYCVGCLRIHAELEDRRTALPRVGQTDMGVVPFELPDRSPDCPWWFGFAIAGGALVVGMFCVTGMWFVGRGLIHFALVHTR
jgi:hypothetical protein